MFKGSVVALVTPMLDNGTIDYASLHRLVEYHIECGTDGIVVAGTTGESVTLTIKEKQAVIKYVSDTLREYRQQGLGLNMKLLVGNGSSDTANVILSSKILNEYDFDAYLTVVPYYNKPSQRGLQAHFEAVADACSKPIFLYNVPGRTSIDLLPETVANLAKVDNIIGIKEASGDLARVLQLKRTCPEDFWLLSGDDSSAFDFIQRGGHGVISVTANVAPMMMSQMCKLLLNGEQSKAREISSRLALLHKRLFIDSNPAPAKWILQHCSLISSSMVRLPLLPLEPIHQNAVKEAMRIAGLI